VAGDGYASNFGTQWNAYPRTQLDSHTGTTISRDRLARCLGGSLGVVALRNVLEVGCGAGRFTELLLAAGARVFACDLSNAVDANRLNCGASDNYFVCQADAESLPIRPRSFSFVVALGMVQHTRSPERTIEYLADALEPGGVLVLDHACPSAVWWRRLLRPVLPREVLRQVVRRLPGNSSLAAAAGITRVLLPVHRALWRRGPVVDRVRLMWRRLSPVCDYYDDYPELGARLEEWALLDTHDLLSDRNKHLRRPEQIAGALTSAGLDVIECRAGGNGVEARARRP
jgi:SAM-dependent methyltransferase